MSHGAVLDACVARGLKMVCCNPDYIALVSFGTGHMPGALARAYEERGGTVISFGKPSTAAFEAGLALLGGGIPKERVCHVGDSLAHDVAGASAAMFAIVIPAGNAIGPPLGGMLIDLLGGLPMTATVYFLLVYSVAVPMVGILVYKYAKRPEKGCMAQAPADEILSGEEKAEALLQKAEKAA